MALANTRFKAGDRVYYFGLHADYGIVVSDDVTPCTLPEKDSFWVKWDSDGSILHVNPREVELVERVSYNTELTVQNCVDFLISQGYTVSPPNN